MTTYAFGAGARLSTQVRVDGVLVDPASISLSILLPDNTIAGPFAPASDGTGLYHYDYASAQPGRHVARWVTVSPGAADEQPFEVAALWGEAGILSLAEAKAQLNIASAGDDEEVRGFIRSVTAVCERYVGALVRATYVEKHRGGYGIALNRAPVLSVASVVAVEAGGVDQQVADLEVDGPTGIVQRLDGCRMCGPFRVTYVAGRTDLPPHVRQAALIILQHLWETQRGGQRDSRFTGAGDEAWSAGMGFAIPRRALELLGDQMPGIA